MTDLLALEYVEIDLPMCGLTYGVLPCQASLSASPPTGTQKCFNTFATCQDTANIALPSPPAASASSPPVEPVTIRFARATDYLPRDIDALPYLEGVSYSPATVSLGENLGQRAELKFELSDHPHPDVGPGFDPYYTERSYNPYEQGTIFGKLRARFLSLRGAAVRWRMGFVGDALEAMETRHFFIESFDGPTPDGKFTIIAKDVLKFLDGDRAIAPLPSEGFLTSDITETQFYLELSPVGAGADYPASGYVNIGGNEIASFENQTGIDTIDSDTLFLLHGNGTDTSTTFTDSSASGLSPSAINGNVQIDTSASKFGGASILFDGSGDYITWADNNIWTPTTDWTVDFWVRFSSVGAIRPLFLHMTDASNVYAFRTQADNSIQFIVTVGAATVIDVATAASQVVADTWYHIALEKIGTVYTIYKDGVVLTSETDATTIPNFTSVFRLGTNAAANAFHAGWIDEFRVSDVARYGGVAFNPYPFEYSDTGADDAFLIERAQLGTVAATHNAEDRVQLVLRYAAESPADIINDLITEYTDIADAYIPLAEWQLECDTYLGVLYTFNITEPTPVNKIVSEIILQAALALWDDNLNEQIRLQVLRGVPLDAVTYDDSNIRERSFAVTDQDDKRVSQVLVYYGQIDPTKRVEDDDNYRSTAHVTDADSELQYGASIRKIHARGIAAAGSAVAERLAAIVLARYKLPPRNMQLELMRESVSTPELGSARRIEFWNMQDANGAVESVPAQIIRLRPSPAIVHVELEEMRFDPIDLSNRQLTYQTDALNVNLRDAHDELYPTPESGDQVTCTINSGVIIGSATTGSPAFDVGDWPAGVLIDLIVLGRIEGRGGNGGDGAVVDFADDGAVGGTALYTRYAITMTDATGEIWGGGGGGGGGAVTGGGSGGGGGGAGSLGGIGGVGQFGGSSGTDGTPDAGGPGGVAPGPVNDGGAGGGPGLSGSAGSGTGAGNGAANGLAIDGISFITTSGAPGDRQGGTAN